MLALAASVPTLLLAAVLVISGVAKLQDATSVRESFITLQLPPRLTSSPAPALLPWGELILAVALLVLPGLWGILAAAAALMLCLAYLVIIVRASRFDSAVECGCLGRLGLGVVGPVTVVRNLVLVAIAAWAVVDAVRGRSVLARWLDADAVAWAWLAVAAVGVILTGLMMYAGQDRRPTPTEAGQSASASQLPATAATAEDIADYERSPIPHIRLKVPSYEESSAEEWAHLRALAMTQARLLVFINPGCGACLPALNAVGPLRARIGELIGIHLVFAREADAHNSYVTPEALGEEWFIDPEHVFTGTLQLSSPGAVLLGADGYLAGGPVMGSKAVVDFFEEIAEVLLAGQPEEPASPDLTFAVVGDHTTS